MDKAPLVSVVVPVYNMELFCRKHSTLYWLPFIQTLKWWW